jgi:hypothetical protein
MAIAVAAVALAGACKSVEREALEEARRQVEAEQRAAAASGQPAKVQRPPVPGQAKVPCEQLVDPAAYQAALGEREPLALKDQSKTEPDAAASCALFRGGKRPGPAEQQAILKRAGRLGVLPGDLLCHVTAFCSTIEDAERLRATCRNRHDDSMGTYACVEIVMQGADDVPVFHFFDADTRCRLRVGGGPSNVDGDSIRTCAKVARDTIGPAQIAVPERGAPRRP